MVKYVFCIGLLFGSFFLLNAQNIKIEVEASGRVDMANQEVNEIFELYSNYLNSRPDSIYNNPYWNAVEKSKYNDFDFSRASLFQGGITPSQLFSTYPPFVLSIDEERGKYYIRILFSSNSTNKNTLSYKVWCIQKLAVIKENDKWVLENLRPSLTKKWYSSKIGIINYRFHKSHNFNALNAEKSNDFCNQIIKRFNSTYSENFDFYITDNMSEMGLLENFDFYFVGSSNGKSNEGMILSAKGDEFYPHEFIHQLLPKNDLRSYVIDEGLAVYLGTKMNAREYQEQLSKLAKDCKRNRQKYNFHSVVSQQEKYNGYSTAYPGGAVICELIYRVKGDAGLLRLMLADTSSFDKIKFTIQEITGLTEFEITEKWNSILNEFHE